MRAVLDANVHIPALLSAAGTPAQLLRAFVDGRFELVVSPKLLSELQRALGYAKLQRHIDIEESAQSSLGSARPPCRSRALVATRRPDQPIPRTTTCWRWRPASRHFVVSGDRHLLQLADELPIHSPAESLRLLGADER